VRDPVIGSEKLPTWPLKDDKGNIICNRQKLAKDFHPWSGLSTQGAAIHFGEMVADPYDAARLAKQIRAVLDTHGFPKAESILSEWNLSADFMDDEKHTLQGAENAAYIGAVLNYLQDAPIDHAQFSRGDAAWMGLFDLKGQYFKTAYTFKAFAKMLDSVRRLLVTGADIFGFSVIAGRSEDGKSVQVITPFPPATNRIRLECRQNFGRWADRCRIFQQLSVCRREQTFVYRNNAGYSLTASNLPWGNDAFTIKRYRISKSETFELVEEKSGAGGSLKTRQLARSRCRRAHCFSADVTWAKRSALTVHDRKNKNDFRTGPVYSFESRTSFRPNDLHAENRPRPWSQKEL
jgi:hypothetical protein